MRNGIATSILTLTIVVACCTSNAFAVQEFDRALEASEFPWYDSETGQVKPGAAPTRPNSRVSDRGDLTKAKKIVVTPKAPPVAAVPGPVGGNAGLGTILGNWIVYIIAGVLVAILVAALIYGFLQRESEDAGEGEVNSRRKIRDHVRHLPFEVEEQDGDFETFADRAFANGNYSQAVIYLFADVLVGLNEGHLVRLQRGKTNRQYLNEIHDRKEIAAYYRTVMTAFEDAFFGKHTISKARAELCFAGREQFNQSIHRIKQERFAARATKPVGNENGLKPEALV